MEKNVGSVDRIVRFIVGAVLAIAGIAGFAGVIEIGSGSLIPGVLVVVGLVVLVTATIQWCPPYSLLGVNTCDTSDDML